ncbi:gliding motility protein GldL [Dokdonia sinensis]|uniref:Gliding motility protein GldL n=1 Tax=Dokdonia sinensis TaxID=2479847 RepID=A0A3M0G2W0_9FLAO|nr:gliding motility protein GldL [Dokdonia sinensis]RMB59105.1 gliding motility protein GldL [Dokdonia sinensis]
MKVKHILALFVLGFTLTIAGSLFKVMHWQFAPELLIFGMGVSVIAGFLLIWKLLTIKDFKGFLNS